MVTEEPWSETGPSNWEEPVPIFIDLHLFVKLPKVKLELSSRYGLRDACQPRVTLPTSWT